MSVKPKLYLVNYLIGNRQGHLERKYFVMIQSRDDSGLSEVIYLQLMLHRNEYWLLNKHKTICDRRSSLFYTKINSNKLSFRIVLWAADTSDRFHIHLSTLGEWSKHPYLVKTILDNNISISKQVSSSLG